MTPTPDDDAHDDAHDAARDAARNADEAPSPGAAQSADADSASPPPVTAQMMQDDPRITHDVIELTNPNDPDNTYDI